MEGVRRASGRVRFSHSADLSREFDGTVDADRTAVVRPTRTPEQGEVTTCTIITAGPNEITKPFHDRTPVQLPPQFWDDWLDEAGDPAKLQTLLMPYDSKKMQCWPVSSQVNSTRKGDYVFGPECITPVEVPSKEGVQALF